MEYRVRVGDTVTGIAKKFGVSVGALHEANKNIITNIHILQVGWVLKIPPVKQELKEALNQCLSDIEKLESFQNLKTLL